MRVPCWVILIIFSMALLMPSVNAQSQAIIMPNHTGYLDNTTIPITYHVVGEVNNIGHGNVQLLNVTANFYAQDNSLIGSSSAYTFLDVLLPNRKVPFEVVFADVSVSQIHNYSLNLEFKDYFAEKPLALQILENAVYKDEAGFTKVNGTVKNLGNSNATAVKVIATFYDNQSRVTGVGYDYSFPSTIMPGYTEHFELEIGRKITQFSSYTLTAESTEYESTETGLTIDLGEAYTTKTLVKLTPLPENAGHALTEMRFSNDNATFSDWETFNITKTWSLQETEGVKTVYVQYRYDSSLTSSYYFDTIILDLTAPEITIASPYNGSTMESSKVVAEWTGSDATSGMSNYDIRLDNGSWIDIRTNTTQTYTNLTDGEHQISIMATDKAGLSKQVSIEFFVNTSFSIYMDIQTAIILAATSTAVAVLGAAFWVKSRKSRRGKRTRPERKRR